MAVAFVSGMRPSKLLVITFITFLLALAGRARADWMTVLPGAVDRVVATYGIIAAIRDGEIWIMREDCQVLGRHGLAQRRSGRQFPNVAPSHAEPSPALAASANAIWIADKNGLGRVLADGSLTPVLGREFHAALLAASNDRLLVGQGNRLDLISTSDQRHHTIELSGNAAHVALSAHGQRMAWVTSETLSWIDPVTGRHDMATAGSVLDLAFCGETLVAVLDAEIMIIPPVGQPETRTPPVPLRRLVCAADPGLPWLALGDKLLFSLDGGERWQSFATPAGGALVDIAASAHRLWLATRDGLLTFAREDTPADLAPARIRTRRSHAVPTSATWLSWLPKVSLRASATFSPAEHQVQALAFAAFPLDPTPVPVPAAVPADAVEGKIVERTAPTKRHSRLANLPDPDAACLVPARRKAVELAMSEPERARSYIARAGHAAWLPELRVLVSRRYGRSESLDVNNASAALSSPLGIDTVNDIRYEARATWDLAKLVFASEELAAQTQALHMAELRRDIETTVNRLYFERRRLALDEANGRDDGEDLRLRMGHVEAELDALSGGVFASCAAKKSSGGAGEP